MPNTKATKIVLFFLALLIGVLFGLKIIYRNQSKISTSKIQNNLASPTPNSALETKFQTIEINNQRLQVEIANTTDAITKGLSNRDQISSDGLLFIFNKPSNQPFWMKDMRFPIDLLWINNSEVIGLEKNLPIPAPNTLDSQLDIYPPPSSITAVLELPAGSIERLNIKIGDEIKY